MGSVGAPELLVIFLVALIVLGPERLPKMARQMGKAMAEFRRVTGGFQDEVRKAMDDVTGTLTGGDDTEAAGTATSADVATNGSAATSSAPVPARAADGGSAVPQPGDDGTPVPAARPIVPADDLPPPPDDPSRN